MIYKALHRKLKIEVNRGPPKGLAGPAPLLTPVVLLLTTILPILFSIVINTVIVTAGTFEP